MNKLKMLVVGMLAMLSFGMVSTPVMAEVQCPEGSIRPGTAPTLAECNLESGGTPLMRTVQTIINVALSLMGIVAVVMIIVGGFQYVTSAGDAAKATKAKNTIMYAVIGLVVALLAFAIVNFVLDKVFSASGATNAADTTESTESAEPADTTTTP